MGDDNNLKGKVAQLEESIDTTAMITWMNAEVAKVSGRWQTVCTVYKDAWKAGMDLHLGALQDVSATKKAREEAARNRINVLFELACVFQSLQRRSRRSASTERHHRSNDAKSSPKNRLRPSPLL